MSSLTTPKAPTSTTPKSIAPKPAPPTSNPKPAAATAVAEPKAPRDSVSLSGEPETEESRRISQIIAGLEDEPAPAQETPEATPETFKQSSLGRFSRFDKDADGFLAKGELKAAQGNSATAEDAATARTASADHIQRNSNDEWLMENDGATEKDLKKTGEADETRYQQELSRQRLRDGHQHADDVPHGYDSVYGAEPTHQQKIRIGERTVGTAELDTAHRTEEEKRNGVTMVDRERVVDDEARPGLDRLMVVSAPQDEKRKAQAGAATADVRGTRHDDTFRLTRAYDTQSPESIARTNKAVNDEPVPYIGSRSTYQVNGAFNPDHDQVGNPQFTDDKGGAATALASDVRLDLGEGNNTVYIDQPINIAGLPAHHSTSVQGSPNGMDTYNFDEGLLSHEVMPVDLRYNGQSLFEMTGDQVESSDQFNISQSEGGTSRFRVPTNRRPVLNRENPMVQSGRLRYEGEYLVMGR